MSEQTDMLFKLDILRRQVASPLSVTAKVLAQYRQTVETLANRCYFNAGWHAANPDKALPGSAGTANILADLTAMSAGIAIFAKPQRRAKAGRPGGRKPLDPVYVHVLADFNLHKGEKSLLECVRSAAKKKLIDRNTPDATHLRRIERAMADMREQEAARMSAPNVVKFRANKKPPR